MSLPKEKTLIADMARYSEIFSRVGPGADLRAYRSNKQSLCLVLSMAGYPRRIETGSFFLPYPGLEAWGAWPAPEG